MEVIKKSTIKKYKNNEFIEVDDELIVEFPFEIFVNDHRLATLMATPKSLKCLAIGYLFSEGLISNDNDINEILLNKNNNAYIYTNDNIDLSCDGTNRIRTTGCGNGTMPRNFISNYNKFIKNNDLKISVELINKMESQLLSDSELFLRTGGVHNTSLWSLKGEKIIFHEDVGRHNTIDKIIGDSILNNISLSDKVLFTSGRISSEMLIKSANAGICILVSRSTVTTIAKEIADKIGLTLIGFARKNRFNVYSDNYKRLI